MRVLWVSSQHAQTYLTACSVLLNMLLMQTVPINSGVVSHLSFCRNLELLFLASPLGVLCIIAY